MKRLAILAMLAASLVMIPQPANAAVRFGFGFGYGRHAFARSPLWIGPEYWAPPLYYVTPARSSNSGELKIDTNATDATVYINGAFAGTVKNLKTVRLRSGTYDIEVRSANNGVFDQKVFVPIDKKIVIEPVFTASSR